MRLGVLYMYSNREKRITMTHIMTPEAVEVVTEVAVQELIEAIKEDYSTWSLRSGKSVSDTRLKMIEEFNTDIGFSEGKKYIKITQRNGGCVWGFVVNCDNDAKFKRGDILKPAGFNSPVRNFSRGNIFSKYKISWAGL